MSKKEWLAGMKAIYPVCFGYIPMGLACGVLLQQAGYHWLAVMLMSLIIYGGASQFMIASMTVAGAGLLEMVIMIFFINLRHLLMSSSLAHRIREKNTALRAYSLRRSPMNRSPSTRCISKPMACGIQRKQWLRMSRPTRPGF